MAARAKYRDRLEHSDRMAVRREEQRARRATFRDPDWLASQRAKYCAALRLMNAKNGVGSSKRAHCIGSGRLTVSS